MPFRPFILVLLLGLGAATLGAPPPARAASALIPLDHPAYARVEGWATRGVLPATPLTARPYTWERLAALLDGARPAGPMDAEAIAALRAEAAGHLEGRPVRAEASVTAAAAQGRPVHYPNIPAENGGPLGAFDGGVAYRETFGADLKARVEARGGRHLAAVVEPRLTLGEVGAGHPGWQEGYLAVDLGPVSAVAGRQPFAWGPGRYGGFLLSPNAAPLPALRLGLKAPHAFTGRWRLLGTWDFAYLLTRLESDRFVPRPYLTGLRVMWMPVPRLEVGAGRTITFGGTTQPGVGVSDFLTILSGRNLQPGSDTSNSIAGFDFAYTVPGPIPLRLYAEYAGEDEAHVWPTKQAIRGGLLLPGLGHARRYTLRTEFAATDVFYDHQRWGHNFWYTHGVYQSGYTYLGRILGDPMGSDARTARLWLTRDGPRARTELMLGWFAARFSDPDREDHWQTGAGWSGPGSRGARLGLEVRLERVNFADARPDAWQSLLLATVSRRA